MTSLQTASHEELREAAARICRDYLTGRWKLVAAEKLIVKRISGGLSNFLYYVSLPEDENLIHEENGATNISDIDCADLAINDKNRNETQNLGFEAGDGYITKKRLRSDDSDICVNAGLLKPLHSQQTEPKEVLLRIYGQSHGENALEAMITESVVFALLSERNFGPKLHGIFPGGRIEQYIQARPLATKELGNYQISMKIAEKMGEIHSLNIPMSKEPDWLWNCMDRWLKSIENILSRSDWNENIDQVQLVRKFDFCKEAKWLKSVIDEGNYTVLFCHNDLQEGNILYREREAETLKTSHEELNCFRSNSEESANATKMEVDLFESVCKANLEVLDSSSELKRKRSKKSPNNVSDSIELFNIRNSAFKRHSEDTDPDLIIIDFEYCAYNYRGFDLANHFIEWTLDYSNPKFPFFFHHKSQYPTEQQRCDFIFAYLKKLNECIERYVPNDNEVQSLENEVRVFSMFSHLFWSLWSVVNVTSNIEFGYWEYAVRRIREFEILKNAYITRHSGKNVLD